MGLQLRKNKNNQAPLNDVSVETPSVDVGYDFSNIGKQKVEPYSGPQAGVDFHEGDEVEILHSGRPSGLKGKISNFEGVRNGKPMVRIRIVGIPGGDIVPLDEIRKIAQFLGNGPGRPQTDPFVMPEIGETQGHAQKRNTPALQKTCPICQSTAAPDAMNCPNCGAELKNPYTVPRQPTQRSAQVGTYMVNPPANRNVRGPTTDAFERRKKRPHYPILPSDEFADVGNEDHMKQVQESATALGLD